jgi:hypothetical protein
MAPPLSAAPTTPPPCSTAPTRDSRRLHRTAIDLRYPGSRYFPILVTPSPSIDPASPTLYRIGVVVLHVGGPTVRQSAKPIPIPGAADLSHPDHRTLAGILLLPVSAPPATELVVVSEPLAA